MILSSNNIRKVVFALNNNISLRCSVIPLLSNVEKSNIRNFHKSAAKMSVKVPSVKLLGGTQIPLLGYGTWQAKEQELEQAIEAALEAGYRHIDTAHVYENEKVIGRVLKRWLDSNKLTRSDIFVVTKLPPGGGRPESVSKYLKRSLELLQLDFIDLYLVHTPFAFNDVEGDLHPVTPEGLCDLDMATDHVALWQEMEAQVDAGLTKAIGISNFNQKQVERVFKNSKIPPAVLQIEHHLYLQQKELVDYCQKNKIVVTAYSPLGSPGLGQFMEMFGKKVELPDILNNPVVVEIAKKHDRKVAQILLRHIVQRGIVAIPKSTNPERLKQNINVFDFELDEDDMSKLSKLDHGIRILDFSVFNGIKRHPEYPF